MSENEISADEHFGDLVPADPEANGDLSGPHGDIDSESDTQGAEEDPHEVEGDLPAEGDEGVEGDPEDLGPDAIDEDGEPAEEWLPGFEGRFRVGEEAKALAAYQALEKDYSRKDSDYRKQIEEERKAAFEQAAQLLQQQNQTQPSPLDTLRQRQELASVALQDPYTAFQAAVEMGDSGSVDTVLRVIATGNPDEGLEGNPQLASEMRHGLMQMQQQYQAEMQQAEMQRMQSQLAIKQGYQDFETSHPEYKSIPGVDDAMREIATANIHNTNLNDPAAVNMFLEDCYEKAIGRIALQYRQQSASQAPVAEGSTPHAQATKITNAGAKREQKLRSRAETGTSTRGRTEQPSPEDQYGDELLRLSKTVRPF